MNKNLNKSAYSLFARSKYDYAQEVQNLRCAFLCELSTRARAFFLSLVMAMTVLTVTGMAGMNVYAETGTVHVATYDQLREALEDTQGVKTIVVDPQAAEEDGDVTYTVENDEDRNAFYIGFDGPLTVSHDITITTADDVDVFFARSDSFRRDQGKPALFNIDRTGSLELDGLITMTGEEVTTAYNDREFVFSLKSRDGTGEDNDAWNRGQVLQGGFYIQNNGGEYNLGDDVVLEDFHTTDDVEGVEPIHEKETNSLFGAKKSDEEATTEEATEEKTEEATEEKAEETVVAPAPKRMMKNALMGTTPTRSGDASDQAVEVSSGVWEVSSWKAMKDLLKKDKTTTVVNTIIITQDIVATTPEGDTGDKSILLNGRTVTIKGPDDRDKPVHIYRDANDANFPLFKVQNDNNELTLGTKLVLSGKTYGCAIEAEEHPGSGYTKAVFEHSSSAKAAINGKNLTSNSTGSTFELDSNGYLKFGTEWLCGNGTFTPSLKSDAKSYPFEVHTSEGVAVKSLDKDGTYYLYDPSLGKYLDSSCKPKAGSTKEAAAFTAKTEGATGGGTYWTVPGQDKKYTSKTDNELVAKMKEYNKAKGLPEQGCDSIEKTWTSDNFTGGTSISDPKAFFVLVQNSGILNIEGAIIEGFKTDTSITHAAPIVVTGNHNDGRNTAFNMKSGEIRNNTVGYGGDEVSEENGYAGGNSKRNAQKLGELIRDTDPTNTAGGVIFSGAKAEGLFTEKAKIKDNRADAGALIIANGATVKMENSDKTTTQDGKVNYDLEFTGNVGYHHSGAVLVEHEGTFFLNDGSINNNVAWYKGGAVWATEFGTIGLVQWDPYPTAMQHSAEVRENRKDGNFIMNGGELDSNFAFVRAGAVEVESNGVHLVKGTISNNRCKSLGGAIYVEGDSPIYTYTLNIKNGYIAENTSVTARPDTQLDKMLDGNGKLTQGPDYQSNYRGYHRDGDWADWGEKHTGDGGGVWLCAMGGTSIFTSTSGEGSQVIISKNTALAEDHNDESATDNGWGDDFYISYKHGSALVQRMLGTWYEDGKTPGEDEAFHSVNNTGTIVKGPKGMYNAEKIDAGPGIQIINNRARNGGGIAANGTVILGEASNIYRYESEFDITKAWTGVTEKEVTVKLHYLYDGKLYPLKKEGEGDVAYEVKLGSGEAEANNGNKPIYKTGKNTAKAFIPATIKHTKQDGTEVPVDLYKIKNLQGSDPDDSDSYILGKDGDPYINLNNSDHVQALWTYIHKVGRTESVDLKIEWFIKLVETTDEYTQECPMPTTGTATAKVAENYSLVDPVTGNVLDGGTFSVNFSEVKFGQTLTNKPKPWFVKGSYLDPNVRINDAEFKLYHANLDRNTANGDVYKVDLSEGKGEVVDGVKYSQTDKWYYLNITPPESGTDHYLLFETKASNGYILPKAPWGIKYHADGTYEAFRFNDAAATAFETKYANTNILTAEELRKLEILCTEINVPIGTDHKINNDKNEPIKLTKVKGTSATNLSTDVKIAGAKFKLFTTEERPARSGIWYKVDEVEPGKELVSDSNGEIILPRAVTRTAGSAIVYWLEETQAAPGYVKNPAPWLIWVTDGRITHLRYATPSRFDGEKVERGDDEGGYIKLSNLEYIHNEPIEFTKVSAGNTNTALQGATLKIAEIGNSNKADKLRDLSTAWFKETPDSVEHHLQDGTVIDTQTSGSDGKFKFNINKAGVYLIYEETAPKGYKKAINPWILVVKENGEYVLMHNNTTNARVGTEHWNTKNYTKCNGLVLKNERKPIELYKVDEKKDADGNIATDATKLAGATFVITKATKDNDNDWYLTDAANGKTIRQVAISINGSQIIGPTGTDGKLTIENLDPGDYLLFEETAPTGFVWAKSPWLLQVKESSTTGYEWTVCRIRDEWKEKVKKGDSKDVGIVEATSLSGIQSTKRYWPHSWFNCETSVDKLDKLDNTPKYITKVSSTSNTTFLEGAKFKLYPAYTQALSGKLYGYTSVRRGDNQIGEELESDANGRIYLPSSITKQASTRTELGGTYSGVYSDGYLLIETEAAPGYKKREIPWWIKVDEDGNITVTTASVNKRGNSQNSIPYWYTSDFTTTCAGQKIANEPGELKLTKVDKYNHNKPLEGAQFTFYNLRATSISYGYKYEKVGSAIGKSSTSGEDGKFTLPGDLELPTEPYPAGKLYIMEETTAPDGYMLSPYPWLVGIQLDPSYASNHDVVINGRYYKYTIKAWPLSKYGTTGSAYAIESNCDYSTYIENSPSVNLIKVDASTVCYCPCDGKTEIETCDDANDPKPTKYLKDVEFDLFEATVTGNDLLATNSWSKATDGYGRVKARVKAVKSLENGLIELGELADGYYLLYETNNPDDNYFEEALPWRLKVENNTVVKLIYPELGVYQESIDKKYITNSPVYDLPSTGGIGTYWFMIIGAMMMSYAVTSLVIRKKGAKKL